MSESEEKSPFGPGFIAAGIILAAILACGAVLLFTGPSNTPTTTNCPSATDGSSTSSSSGDGSPTSGSPGAGSPTSGSPGAGSPTSGSPGAGSPTSGSPGGSSTASTSSTGGTSSVGGGSSSGGGSSAEGGQSGCGAGAQGAGAGRDGSSDGNGRPSAATSGQPGADPGTAQPAGEAVAQPGSPASKGSGTTNSCGLPDGDQAVPSNQPPKADMWEISRRVAVPRSSAYGPAKTDPDGFRRCFAHSPTGAVYAAYNVIAALADQTRIIPTATKLMVPGRDTDLLLQEVRKETADAASTPAQVAGYRIVDADRDRVTIMLAMPAQTEFMSGTFTLAWHSGDWHLVPPPDAAAVGTPYSQHHNLNDFVEWSGV